MIKHMELCVDLKKQHLAKDALFQYKALTQQVSSAQNIQKHVFFSDQREIARNSRRTFPETRRKQNRRSSEAVDRES